MSIAVTVVVRPSICLRLLQAGFAACALAVAALLPAPILSISCALASLAALCRALCSAKTHRLDISGIGQIRLAVYLLSADSATPAKVALQAGSTCWPWLLLLRLGHEDGAVTLLAVLPDSVAPGQFRPLALACRACAAKKL
jgi:toxin CptA